MDNVPANKIRVAIFMAEALRQPWRKSSGCSFISRFKGNVTIMNFAAVNLLDNASLNS